jgi:hypothetical protein
MPRHLGGLSRSRPKSGSRIRYSDQTGIPDFPNPGFRPNRGSSFPESRDVGQMGFKCGKIRFCFCSGQNRDCTLPPASAVPCRGPCHRVGAEAHRPATRGRQRPQAGSAHNLAVMSWATCQCRALSLYCKLYISLRAAIARLLWRSMTNFEKMVGDVAICLSDMTSSRMQREQRRALAQHVSQDSTVVRSRL